MSDLFAKLSKLSAAEEFFDFFGVAYEPRVVHVNRLHILKRFNQYLRNTPALESMDEDARWTTCKELLECAYHDFVRSTPAQEKVFKVFQDADGGHVRVDDLRRSLPSRNKGA